MIAEVYPSLRRHNFERQGRTPDQHDTYSVAAWMRGADLDGTLSGCFNPPLTPADRVAAKVEGSILGVM